jgi:hypothetical protein
MKHYALALTDRQSLSVQPLDRNEQIGSHSVSIRESTQREFTNNSVKFGLKSVRDRPASDVSSPASYVCSFLK